MRHEPKITSDIQTVEDVEDRIYHAFRVMRTWPSPSPKPVTSLIGLWSVSEYPEDAEPEDWTARERFATQDQVMAEEVLLNWLPKAHIDVEDKALISYRCGAPVVLNGHDFGLSGVRRWKDVAYAFHCHRNTAKKRWSDALTVILREIFNMNCA